MRRDSFWAAKHKRNAVNAADAAGEIADSVEYRNGLIQRVNNGEITLEQAKAELSKTKRNAKKNGKSTRAEVWRRS